MTTTTAADTAKLIRADLKVTFPGVKFSVKSSTFSMGSSVDVKWTDGPLVESVEALISHYGNGQHRFVMCTRSMGDATRKLIEDCADPAEFVGFISYDDYNAPEYFAGKVFRMPDRFPRTAQRAGLVAA